MSVTVYFRDVEDDVVVWEFHPQFELGGELGYDIVENGFTGRIEVRVEGECLVAVGGDERVVLRDSREVFELVAGQSVVFARPGAELPDWSVIRRAFYSGS